MVSPKDYVDLEPEPKDILLVYGLELTQQKLEKVVFLARSLLGKRGGTGLAWNVGGGLGLLEESKPFSTKTICWLLDTRSLVDLETVVHLADITVEMPTDILVSPKNPIADPNSGFLMGVLEDIVKSSGFNRK